LISNKEKESIANQNLLYKSMILKIFNKISTFEMEERGKKDEITDLSLQVLKENEYLRLAMATTFGNSVTREINSTVEPIHEKGSPIGKRRRNPTQINFDFLHDEDLNQQNENVENANDEQINDVNKFVSDFKLVKKSKTIKPNVETSRSNNASSTSGTTNDSNGNYLSKKLDNHQTNIKPKQHYLFPKTPNNDEKKNFDFKNDG